MAPRTEKPDELGAAPGVVVPVDPQRHLALRDPDQPPVVEADRVVADLGAVLEEGRHAEAIVRPAVDRHDGREVVERGVEQEGDRHGVVVAHDVVLVSEDRLVEVLEVAVVLPVVLRVFLRHLLGGRAGELLQDEPRPGPHGERHLVEPRRVEGIQESARVADLGPTGTDELVHEVRQVRVVPAVALDRRGALDHLARERVGVQEARELLERRTALGGHEPLVPHEADAHLAVMQRDEPDPVAPAREVIGRQRAAARSARGATDRPDRCRPLRCRPCP